MKQSLFIVLACSLLLQGAYARQSNIRQREGSWPLHGWAEYLVDFKTHVMTDFASLGTQGQDTSLTGTLQGKLRTECMDTSAGRQFFHAYFPQINRCQFPLPSAIQKTIADLLKKGFYYSRAYSGLVDSVWFPEAVSDAAEHVVIQLLEPFQWYYPLSTARGDRPVMTLSDGLARASFSDLKSDSCARQLRLDSLAWIHPGGQPGVLARRIEYTVDSRYCFGLHYVQVIDGQVVRKAKVNHKTVTVLTNRFRYTLVGSGERGSLPDRRSTGLYARPLYYPGRLEQKVRENQVATAQRISIAGVVKALKENERLQDVNRQDVLAEAVKLCFAVNKDSLDLLRDVFIAAPVQSITFKTMRTGLVTASTPYAQQVLNDFIRQNRDAADKLRKLIPSAGLVRKPSVMLQQTLGEIAFDSTAEESLSTASLLALGNMAGTMREDDVVRSDSLTQRLGRLLQPRGDDMLLLSVMGNSGSRAAMPYIIPYLSDPDKTVRAYAYYALRFIRATYVDSVYAGVLKTAEHPAVLTNVFNALFLRPGSDPLSAALLRLVDTAAEPVRLEALQVLFEWSYREPALLTNFREIAVRNNSEAVKKAARQFLARAEE